MSSASTHVLSTAGLLAAVEAARSVRRVPMRTVARETGLTPATLSKLRQGRPPDADGLVSLLRWLGHDVPFSRPRDAAEPQEAP